MKHGKDQDFFDILFLVIVNVLLLYGLAMTDGATNEHDRPQLTIDSRPAAPRP
jgi:hypothetical protein